MDTNNTVTDATVKAESKPAEQAVQSSGQPTLGNPAVSTDGKEKTSTPAVTQDTNKDIFAEFAMKIIKEQEGIIGPIAYEQALKVPGLTVDPNSHSVMLTGDKKQILENLVKQYELLFGRVSIEICKEAVRSMISQAPADQVPQILL